MCPRTYGDHVIPCSLSAHHVKAQRARRSCSPETPSLAGRQTPKQVFTGVTEKGTRLGVGRTPRATVDAQRKGRSPG